MEKGGIAELFRWGNRLLWTRPINHDIFSVSFMVFPLVLFCWIQKFTRKCHEAKLFQIYKLKYLPQLDPSFADFFVILQKALL